MSEERDHAYFEDWCISAFRDLSFSYYMCVVEDSINPFTEYRAFYCHQAIEKILKAWIVKNSEKDISNNCLKQYSHNLFALIKEIISGSDTNRSLLPEEEKSRLIVPFVQVGNIFVSDMNIAKRKNSDGNSDRHLNEIKDRYPDLENFCIFLELLSAAFLEIRYPKEMRLHCANKYHMPSAPDYNLQSDDIAWNTPLPIATIYTFKLLISLFDKQVIRPYLMQFTWSEQKNYFEYPLYGTIETYKILENLYNFVFDIEETLFVNSWRTISNLDGAR